jgi:hypothetical protein
MHVFLTQNREYHCEKFEILGDKWLLENVTIYNDKTIRIAKEVYLGRDTIEATFQLEDL